MTYQRQLHSPGERERLAIISDLVARAKAIWGARHAEGSPSVRAVLHYNAVWHLREARKLKAGAALPSMWAPLDAKWTGYRSGRD